MSCISSDLYGRTGNEKPLVDAAVNRCGLEVFVSLDVELARAHALFRVLNGHVFAVRC